jgi:hypothetical protein
MVNLVWISHAPSDSTLSDGFMKTDLNVDDNQRVIEISNVARNGGVVDATEMPTEAWGEVGEYRAHHFPEYWPEISCYNDLWLISGKISDILRGFDIGNGVISPVRLFKRDRFSPVPGTWFFWNVGNVKEAFIPERSEHIRPAAGRKWRPLRAADHDLKCSVAANTGPDVWFDPKLRGVLFLGGALGQALIDGELANEMAGFGKLIKCDVVEG